MIPSHAPCTIVRALCAIRWPPHTFKDAKQVDAYPLCAVCTYTCYVYVLGHDHNILLVYMYKNQPKHYRTAMIRVSF